MSLALLYFPANQTISGSNPLSGSHPQATWPISFNHLQMQPQTGPPASLGPSDMSQASQLRMVLHLLHGGHAACI